jgi:HprK-related kinase A
VTPTSAAPAPGKDLYLRTGPFITHLVTSNWRVREGIELLYDPVCRLPAAGFSDFHIVIKSPHLRRWLRPKVSFFIDGASFFTPSPPEHSLPLFEWGLNRVIAETVHHFLVVHAASVERGGRAMILPGEPGAGKSTLTAGLVFRGWRLLSDELTLIKPGTAELAALARPISLKNDSIGIIRRFAPDVVMSRPAEGTIKGTIALARPPAESVRRAGEAALAGWIVFPNYTPGAPSELRPRPKTECFLELATNALNYSILGELGFDTLVAVVSHSRCFELVYSDLEDGVRLLTEMADAA